MEITFRIKPVAKPRMTRSDKWKLRPVVVKYREFADELRRQSVGYNLPSSYRITFGMRIPDTTNRKLKERMVGTPHDKRPDLDNLIKSVNDVLLAEDSKVWKIEASKIWAMNGFIHIEEI